MPRIVRGALIQATWTGDKESMIQKHEGYAKRRRAGRPGDALPGALLRAVLLPGAGAQYYSYTEHIPDGPTTSWMQALAKKTGMVLVVPDVREERPAGVYYNTAAVIDADGTYLGKYRKTHIPHVNPGFWEKFYFQPGNLGYPVFETRVGKIGVYICYDRHFPEGARALGLNGAEIVFNPSATVAGLSRVPVEARAAGARGGQRVLRGRDQPRRHRGAVEHRRVLRHELLRAIRAARSSRRRQPGQRRARRRRPGPGHDRRGAPDLAVLPRSPARPYGDLVRPRVLSGVADRDRRPADPRRERPPQRPELSPMQFGFTLKPEHSIERTLA